MRRSKTLHLMRMELLIGTCFSYWMVFLPLWLCIASTPADAFVKLLPGFTSRPSFDLAVHSLITCLESLSEERNQTEQQYQFLSWLELSQKAEEQADDDDDDDDVLSQTTMPLYPLGAVYLPTKSIVNHTLNNVEPQNIRMAEDLLLNGRIDDLENLPKFCVVLRAMDTGRIASIGTVMSIVDAEKQFHYGTNDTARIRLTCQGEELVEICHIENGDHWGTKRLMKSQDYLQVRVKPFHLKNASTITDRKDFFKEKLVSLSKDFRTIKTMYQLDLGSQDFPPRMLPRLGDAIQDIAIGFDEGDKDAEVTLFEWERIFWMLAQEWQSICYTLRQGQQTLLSAERNELMVEAACAKGGPLNLPIHMEDLEPQDRRRIQRLELKAQQRHIEIGMDPVLDFQVLISLPDLEQKITWLGHMVTRERQRLVEFASLQYSIPNE